MANGETVNDTGATTGPVVAPAEWRETRTVQRVAEIEQLAAAWETVRRNDLAAMRRSAEVRAFGRGLGERLPKLREALLTGTYCPKPLRAVVIPKRRGGHRELQIPAVADRVVERAIATALEETLDPIFTPWSFAYRPGLSVADAVARIVQLRDDGGTLVVRADVADCFPSLERARLLARFRELVDEPELASLIEALLARPVRTRDRLRQPRHGVPQGGLCSAEHKPPYEQCWVMRSVGLSGLVGAGLRVERCA